MQYWLRYNNTYRRVSKDVRLTIFPNQDRRGNKSTVTKTALQLPVHKYLSMRKGLVRSIATLWSSFKIFEGGKIRTFLIPANLAMLTEIIFSSLIPPLYIGQSYYRAQELQSWLFYWCTNRYRWAINYSKLHTPLWH